MAKDLTVEILKQIRDGVTSIGQRLDQTNVRLDETNVRLGQTNDRLGRVEQGLTDLGKFMRTIALDQERHERFHHVHVEKLETDVRALEGRVEKLEGRTG